MQEQLLSHFVDSLHRDVSFFCGETLRKKGITVGLMYFILYVCKHPGCTPAQLARDLALDRAYVLRTINKLVENGFCKRVSHPTDGRATMLYATEKGEEIFEISHDLLHRWDMSVLEDMTEAEKEQLFVLLSKIENKIQKKGK